MNFVVALTRKKKMNEKLSEKKKRNEENQIEGKERAKNDINYIEASIRFIASEKEEKYAMNNERNKENVPHPPLSGEHKKRIIISLFETPIK